MLKNKCWCGQKDTDFLFSAEGHDVVKCRHCGQVCVIATHTSAHRHLYRGDDIKVYVEKEKMFRELFQDVIQFIRRYKNRGTLADIGAGVGLLVDEARRAGYQAVGFEPSKTAVSTALARYHIRLRRHTFSSASIRKPIDIIVFNHVLEHLNKPKAAIKDAIKVLKPDGLLIVGVPNFGSYMSLLKKSRWQSLVPREHRWQFTLTTLDRLILPFGFTRIGLRTESHDRSMHTRWKRLIYAFIDTIALATNKGEAILAAYQKNL